MPLSLIGLGTAVPKRRISQQEALALAPQMGNASPRQQRLLERIYQRSGVMHRHCIPLPDSSNPSTAERMRRYQPAALELAQEASRLALKDAGIEASTITHLITVSCTGFGAPGFDLALIAKLPLAMDVARTHVGFMGCHGAFNGLRVARAFVEADPSACVLLCAVELCSLHLQEGWNPDHIVANALFADGAGAVVAVAADGSRVGSTNKTGLELVASSSTVLPGTEDLMSWIIEDHGFSMVLSSKVPSRIAAQLRPWLEQWLTGMGLTLPEVKTWAVHPGGPRILGAVLESAGLQPAQIDLSTAVLRHFGNMSSATILFILERLRTSARHDGPCLALGFGPGLTVEAALLMVQKPI
ncbi:MULTISPECIES: type III polyketide synthase [unclassified Cyanobium]|uniref:type III polyketide synthase n=1 Tax=unclassified Cyanobium TaxID=2627006 RepID=UPI0020CD8206|nr:MULTISPECIES: type III polyketide synthase [unclassified Cyanobium]MCP9778186.1 type III polyketide synthase [Cyanobium sp. Tous-M-B4]MCP9876582.1 type III polyketide synthase [Cyanobium sp. A2C-AMD]